MPRQSRGRAAPARPAPKPAASVPQQHRPAATHAATPYRGNAPTPQPPAAAPPAQSQGPGLFGQMASTAAYVFPPPCPAMISRHLQAAGKHTREECYTERERECNRNWGYPPRLFWMPLPIYLLNSRPCRRMPQEVPFQLTNPFSRHSGVAVGSSIGHAVGSLFTGGGSSGEADAPPASAAPAQAQQQQQQPPAFGQCQAAFNMFSQCMDQNGNDGNACQWYWHQLVSAYPYLPFLAGVEGRIATVGCRKMDVTFTNKRFPPLSVEVLSRGQPSKNIHEMNQSNMRIRAYILSDAWFYAVRYLLVLGIIA